MKIARYKGKIYEYIRFNKHDVLITSNPDKIDENFNKFHGVYHLQITESILKDISDIFDIEYFVEYDTGLKNVPLIWDYFHMNGDGTKIQLVFYKGFLPGWEIEDKGICCKWIDVSEISQAKVITTIEKKDGQILNPPIIEERTVDAEQMVNEYLFYRNETRDLK